MKRTATAAGKSSFDLIDRQRFRQLVEITPGDTFLDLACGAGNYSLELAARLNGSGTIWSVDLWHGGIAALKQEIASGNLDTIVPLQADICERLPIDSKSADGCLMATVLHDLSPPDRHAALAEAARVLKPGGKLYLVEFKELNHGPGPPLSKRLGPAHLEEYAVTGGFGPPVVADLGRFTYLAVSERCG